MSAAAPSFDRLATVERSPGYWAGVLKRFGRDKVAMAALIVVVLLVLMAIFAPLVAPADPYRGSMIRRLRPIGTPGSRLVRTNSGGTCSRGSSTGLGYRS